MNRAWLLLLSLILSSCSPRSAEDFRERGEALQRALVIELQTVNNAAELKAHAPRLKSLFNILADLAIQARSYRDEKPQAFAHPSTDFYVAEMLKAELSRLYTLEGCRKLMEECQQEALLRLHKFENDRLKALSQTQQIPANPIELN